jgi:protein-S-isoprenylcysteine O-methyltransferase Ste14
MNRKTVSPSFHNSAGVLAPPPLLYLGAFLAAYVLHRTVPMRLLGFPLSTAVGVPLLLFGLLIIVWSWSTMNRAGTTISPYKPALSLVTHGPYRYSRNPIYLALTSIYVACGVLLDSPWPLLMLAGLIPLMQWRVIAREEHHLSARFGDTYQEYTRSVRRWL